MLLTPDQEMIRDAVRDFAQRELWPHAAAWDKQHHFPKEAHKGLAALGAYGICVPESLGGIMEERSAMAGTLVAEALARGDMGLAVASLAPGAVATALGLWGTDVPALVDQAKVAAATGDHDAARAAARDAVDTVDDASDVGTKRFALAVGALLGMALLVTLLVVVLRRRSARRRAAVTASIESGHDDPAPAVPDEAEHTALLAAFPPPTGPASDDPPPV